MHINIIKLIYDKPTFTIILTGDKSISSKIGNKIRMTILTTFIQHSVGSSGQSKQIRSINKKNPNWKGRSKSFTACR